MQLELEELTPFEIAPTAKRITPLLRWVGGKRYLLPHLISAIQRASNFSTYVEPFFGAGSLYFAIQPSSAIIADLNESLIDFYRTVRDSPKPVYQRLMQLANLHNSQHYYVVRESYNSGGAPIEQAARFLYLNLVGFNGVFRVNQKGQYNVPVGRRTRKDWPSLETLEQVSTALKNTQIVHGSFELTLQKVSNDSFIYLDPPYPVISSTSCFQHYTLERFALDKQEKLWYTWIDLDKAGAQLLMSNSDTPEVRSLYKGYSITEILVPRFVSCKSKKIPAKELLISNYGHAEAK